MIRASVEERTDQAKRSLVAAGFEEVAGVFRRGEETARIVRSAVGDVPAKVRDPRTRKLIDTPAVFYEDKVVIEYGRDDG